MPCSRAESVASRLLKWLPPPGAPVKGVRAERYRKAGVVQGVAVGTHAVELLLGALDGLLQARGKRSMLLIGRGARHRAPRRDFICN